MTQTLAPATPNTSPTPSTPEHRIEDDPFQFMTARNIDQMRDEQKKVLTEAQKTTDLLDPAAKAAMQEALKDRYEEIRKDYLHSFDGMDENHPRYDEFANYLHQVSLMTGTEENNDRTGMSDSEWRNGEFDSKGERTSPSGREMVNEFHDQLLEESKAEQDVTTDDENQVPAPELHPVPADATRELFTPDQLKEYGDRLQAAVEAYQEAHFKLVDARDNLAKLTVKRQGRLSDKQSAEYKEAHDQYHTALIAYGKAQEAMLDAKKGMGMVRSEDEKKATVVEYLLHEAAELRRVTNEKWNNTRVNNICMWMARGNLAQRTLKGLAIGGGVALVATGVGALTAATGGGTLAAVGGSAGAVATLASRMARAYGAARGQELLKGNQKTTMTGTSTDERRTIDMQHAHEVQGLIDRHGATGNGLEIGAKHLHSKHERAIQHEQKENRKAAYISIGALALGTSAALGASEAMEHISEWRSNFQEWVGNGPKPSEVLSSSTPEVHDGDVGGADGGSGDHLDPNLEALKDKYEVMATIDKGMGGEALFKELGIDPQEWYLYEDALLEAHPEDFYRMGDGHVGLAHPGKLSDATMLDLANRTSLLK